VQQHADVNAVDDMAAKVVGLQDQLQDALTEAARFNSREVLMSWPATDYSQLKQLGKDFEPFQQLWQATALFRVSCLASRTVRQIGPAVSSLPLKAANIPQPARLGFN
jgi:hypothetical protein